jgi:quinol monooxygenase YgiN
MISVTHFDGPDPAFPEQARHALEALAARPGFIGGSLGRAVDDPRQWLLVTEWRDVGSYRRALGHYDVKVNATPLLARAIEQPSAFEQLLRIDAAGQVTSQPSDRSDAG